MKTTITTLFFLFAFSVLYSQIIQETEQEDGSLEYLFTLDQFQKPYNYPIEITHLGGNVTKLKAQVKNSKQTGNIRFKDLKGEILFEKKLEKELAFEFNTDKKEVVVECEIAGYISYSRTVKIETLSILILKLQTEPSEDIYILRANERLPDATLKKIMECVNQSKVSKSSDFKSCESTYKVEISVQ